MSEHSSSKDVDTIRVVVSASVVHFFGPFTREIWAPETA